MEQNLKVLVSAYACEPGKGSESGVGWNWVKEMSRFCELWVVTRANNREPIERALGREVMPNVHWIYFDLPRWIRMWKKGRRGIHLYYYLWQVGIYLVARSLHKRVRFDLVHHATFANYWLPSFLALLPVPFVWGPVGGGESAPTTLYAALSLRGRMREHLRDLVRGAMRTDPFLHATAKRARLALATTAETAQRMQRLGARKIKILSQVALPVEELERLSMAPVRYHSPFRLVSVGNLVPFKGFHLGLIAFARMQRNFPSSEYWVIGNGLERRRLEAIAEKHGVAQKVRFFGALPRGQVLNLVSQCDVLVHPSLHDSGGWVCIEAMATGCPVICLDLGGPAFLIGQEGGIKVPAHDTETVLEGLAEAMLRLASNPDLRARMAEAGRRRVQTEYSWREKGTVLAGMYKAVVAADESSAEVQYSLP